MFLSPDIGFGSFCIHLCRSEIIFVCFDIVFNGFASHFGTDLALFTYDLTKIMVIFLLFSTDLIYFRSADILFR